MAADNRKKDRLRTIASRSLRWGGWIVVGLLVAAALGLLASRTWTAVTHRSEFRLHADSLIVEHWPKGVRADRMIEELRAQTRAVMEGRSIFDHDICWRVQHELRGCPWVLDVTNVRRELPNKLTATVVFRQPAAVAQVGGQPFIIDRDGTRLPNRLYTVPESWREMKAPVIVNNRFSDNPRAGHPMDTVSLAVGARLCSFLMSKGLFKELPIARIDVTHVGRGSVEPDVVLVTEGGVVVKWGSTDAYDEIAGLSRASAENTDHQKLHMLRTQVREHPALSGMEYIDLRFNKVFYRPTAGL
jgi:hypothetical protein